MANTESYYRKTEHGLKEVINEKVITTAANCQESEKAVDWNQNLGDTPNKNFKHTPSHKSGNVAIENVSQTNIRQSKKGNIGL